ncbi:hypothetical protein [Nocardia sp. A7]|uniref:hypothetical protein n=1 Tax=Nocardia sp. A7 TaxID=2789274 RepID=UPI00397AAEDB
MDTHELQWIGEHAPAAAEMAAVVDKALAAHTQWDSLHHFMVLGADKTTGRVSPIEIAAIHTAMRPELYPTLMDRLMRTHLATITNTNTSTHTTVGALLQIEGHMVVHSPADPLTLGEQAAIERREMKTVDRSVELAVVYAADPGGRMWMARKAREGDINEPAAIVANYSGGFADGLRRCVDLIAPAYLAAQRSPWARPKGRG